MFFTIDKSEFTPSGKIVNLFFPAFGTSVLILGVIKRKGVIYHIWWYLLDMA